MTTGIKAAAADLVLPGDAVLSHTTAAYLHGFDTVDDQMVHATMPAIGSLRRREGIRAHRARVPANDRTVRHGLRVTTAERTVVDLACLLDPPHGLALVDAALRTGCVSESSLASQLAATRRRRGVPGARRVCAWGDHRAESPPESHTRWLFLASGLPPPEPQVRVQAPGGWPSYRLDLGYRHLMLGFEYDSEAFHASGRARSRDRERFAVLTHLGWRMVYITGVELYRDPWELVSRVARLSEAAGGHVGPLDPAPARLLQACGPDAVVR